MGCAAELIHTATLYHDDVVDDGRVRRGRPAARMVFGNGIVVLVGDFCLARALETVALTGSLPMVQSLATTVTEMAEGEVAQLERAGNPDATVEDYFGVIDRKTASLIAWCARVGGAVAAGRWRSRWSATGARWAAPSRSPTTCSTAPSTRRPPASRSARPAGGQAHPARAAGVRGRPGAAAARVRGQLGEHGVSAADAAPRSWPRCGPPGGVERARAKARALADDAVHGAGWPAGLALPRRAARRWRRCPSTGAPDGHRSGQRPPRGGRPAGGDPRALGRPARRSCASWRSAASCKRITREIDPVLEVSEIAQRVMRAGGPALLFEQVKGSRFPLLINTYATRRRMSWALGRRRPRGTRARHRGPGQVAAARRA